MARYWETCSTKRRLVLRVSLVERPASQSEGLLQQQAAGGVIVVEVVVLQ
jgi:hypothetical protein